MEPLRDRIRALSRRARLHCFADLDGDATRRETPRFFTDDSNRCLNPAAGKSTAGRCHRFCSTRLRLIATVLIVVALGPAPLRAQSVRAVLNPVAERGDAAPDSAGLLFEMFGAHDGGVFGDPLGAPPTIDREGNIAFHAFFGDNVALEPFSFGPRGIFARIDGVLVKIVAAEEPAPGTTGEFFGLVGSPLVTGQGVTFAGSVFDPPDCGSAECIKTGLWSSRFGSPELIMLGGQSLPGMPVGFSVLNFSFDVPDGESIIADVRYRMTGSQTVDDAFEGFWRDRSGQLELVIRDSMPAPGTPPGVVFADAEPTLPHGPFQHWFPNRHGEIIFSGFVDGPGVVRDNNEGIWAEKDGALGLVVREGDSAASAGAGFIFGSASGWKSFGEVDDIPPHLNDSGAAVFGASIHNPQYSRWQSIWTNRTGQLECIAKGIKIPVGGELPEGDPAPGFPAGFDLSHFQFGFINNNDVIAFSGFVDNQTFPQDLSDPVDEGIWWDVSGSLALVARDKGPVPEVPGAVFVNDGINLVRLQEDANTLWWVGTFEGPGVDGSNNSAFFRTDADGTSRIVMRRGDFVSIGPNGADIRQVNRFNFGGGDHVSDVGERVFEIFFTDGSNGLYTANVFDAVPIPGDLNGDGAVNDLDRNLFVQVLLGDVVDEGLSQRADLDGTGTVDGEDIPLFVQAILGLP